MHQGCLLPSPCDSHTDGSNHALPVLVLQGGPHNHQIGALAVALKHASTDEFKKYAQQVRKNCKALADALMSYGHKLVTDGSDNHLVLWDLRPEDITGSKMEKACDLCHITLNKNTVVGDVNAISPGGVRIGTPAMTSRGLVEADFVKVAALLHEVLELCKEVQASHGRALKDFNAGLQSNPKIADIRARVEEWAAAFPMPGFKV